MQLQIQTLNISDRVLLTGEGLFFLSVKESLYVENVVSRQRKTQLCHVIRAKKASCVTAVSIKTGVK